MCPISSKILVNIEGKRKEKKYKKRKKRGEEKRRKSKGCALGCYIGYIREYALGGNI